MNRGSTQPWEEGSLAHTSTWMNLEGNWLSEISQSQKEHNGSVWFLFCEICVLAHVRVSMPTHVRLLPQLLSTLFFETGPLTEYRVHGFGEAGWPMSLWICSPADPHPLSLPSTRVTDIIPAPGLAVVLGIQTHTLVLAWQVQYYANHLTSPQYYRVTESKGGVWGLGNERGWEGLSPTHCFSASFL